MDAIEIRVLRLEICRLELQVALLRDLLSTFEGAVGAQAGLSTKTIIEEAFGAGGLSAKILMNMDRALAGGDLEA